MNLPDSRLLYVCDALITELNVKLSEWQAGATASRKYSVQYDLEEIRALHVDVQVLDLEEAALVDRRAEQTRERHFSFAVVVQQEVDPTDAAAIDTLEQLLDAIYEHWRYEDTLNGIETITLLEKTFLPYVPAFMDKNKRFFGVAGFVFTESS